MRKCIEYTLVSADGVFENLQSCVALSFRDEQYLRDGLGVLLACDAMLTGRKMYEGSAKIWPGRPEPWAVRLNAMQKFVFSSTLQSADWNNTTIIRGDVATEVGKLKAQEGRSLLIWGHTQLAETLMKNKLVDWLDLSIHPVIVGHGTSLCREGQNFNLKLVSTKSFSKIVKLSYELQY
jgi:dihydrofolate reductase